MKKMLIGMAVLMLASCQGGESGRKTSSEVESLGGSPSVHMMSGGVPQASLSISGAAAVMTPYNKTEWNLAKSGLYDESAHAVTYAVTVTRGATSPTHIAVTGFVSITNNGSAPATVGNIVVNLQQQKLYKGKNTWVSAAANVSAGAGGDTATEGTILAAASQENPGANAAVGAGNYAVIDGKGMFNETQASGKLSFTDADRNTAWSLDPTISIPGGTTVSLRFASSYSLDPVPGTLLRAEVLVSFGNAGSRGGSGASGQNIDINGNGIIDADEVNVRTVPVRITQAMNPMQRGNDTVMLSDSCGAVVMSGPATSGPCISDIGDGISGIETMAVSAVRGMVFPQVVTGAQDSLWRNTAHLDGAPVLVTVNGALDPLTGMPSVSHVFELVAAVHEMAMAEVIIPGEMPPTERSRYTTFTQGGWGAPPHGGNPGALLANNFSQVYPGGVVEIGIVGSNGFSMRFFDHDAVTTTCSHRTKGVCDAWETTSSRMTAAQSIEAYLPAGSTPAALNADLNNPAESSAGVFGGQVLALQLNVDFSKAGITEPGLAALQYAPGDGSCMNGNTVGQILAAANTALGGGVVPGCSLGQLHSLADAINNALDNGKSLDGQTLLR